MNNPNAEIRNPNKNQSRQDLARFCSLFHTQLNRLTRALRKRQALRSLPVLAACLAAAHSGPGAVIGHNDVENVASFPQETMDAIGQQKWLFTHASVGNQMIQGMLALQATNSIRYQLGVFTAGYFNVNPPPENTVPGTIYDAPRGNPGWSNKFALFNDAVRKLGWHNPTIGIAMDKLCFVDHTADPTNYIASMTALERDYPAMVFVYTTMPLMTNSYDAEVLRCEYNAVVRNHCVANRRMLFDIADIESHDPAGHAVTFTNEGTIYERMYEGYTTDGGHLNALGIERVTLGWYAMAAALTPQLSITRSPTNTVTVAWPVPPEGLVLEHGQQLPAEPGGSWSRVLAPYQTNAGTVSVTLTNDPSDASQLFRLRKP